MTPQDVANAKRDRMSKKRFAFPYGETWINNKANSEQTSTPYKFTAKEYDEETGLYYYGARYYDAKLSRWCSTDKVMKFHNTQDINLYSYCFNNPVYYIDPDGNVEVESWLDYHVAQAWRGGLEIGYKATAQTDEFRFSDAGLRAIKSVVFYSIVEELSNSNWSGGAREASFSAISTIAGKAVNGFAKSTLLSAFIGIVLSEGYYQVSKKFSDNELGEINSFVADDLALHSYASVYGTSWVDFSDDQTVVWTGDTDRELVQKRLSAINAILMSMSLF